MAEASVARTWDGLTIASDDPMGVTVVVRRAGGGGKLEFLMLHRAAEGTTYEGDWAWTAPAGCRRPREPVYQAALRELAEEAGLTSLQPWAVDVTWRPPTGAYSWALFALDVRSDTAVDLVDPEHDRYEWLTAADAHPRVLPHFVAANQIERVRRIPPAEVSFRRLTFGDLPSVVRWQAAPHVARWWHGEVTTLSEAEKRYGPSLRGEEPTRSWVVVVDGRDAGYMQDYLVGDYADYVDAVGHADAVGFDYLIGEAALTGKGLGTRMIWQYLRDIVAPAYPEAPRFLASPDPANVVSLRVLAKCGFAIGPSVDVTSEGQTTREVVCTLGRRHWFG